MTEPMVTTIGPQYLRDVAMGLRRMGFPISAPSLEQLAAQWEADRAALERLTAAASGRGMASEMDGGAEIAFLVMGLHERAEKAEAALERARALLAEQAEIITANVWHIPPEYSARNIVMDAAAKMRDLAALLAPGGAA